jgi:mannitol/fructose-specific phosphotransferase system IIA component (Ntr-type)
MNTIADILRAEDVKLALAATTREAAIDEVAALLQHDERVLDWDAVVAGFHKAAPCLPVTDEFAICIPHTRTDHVTDMAMSVGRSDEGVIFPCCESRVRYIFCIAVQHALAADYLRIVGLLARIVKEAASEARLRAAANGTEFVAELARLEAKL